MALIIWTKDFKSKVFSALSPVFQSSLSTEVIVHNDEHTLPPYQPNSVVLALGAMPLAHCQNLKVMAKNRTVTSLRNQVFNLPLAVGHLPVMFSYSAGIAEIDYGKYVDLLCDGGMAMRLHNTKTLTAKLGDYTLVENLDPVLKRVNEIHAETSKPVECTFDLETVGLDPYLLPDGDHPGAYIVMMQFSVEVGKSFMIYFKSEAEMQAWFANFDNYVQIGDFLNNPRISLGGANLKYDLGWMWHKAQLKCTNFRFDTTLVGSLLDENRSNGLDIHVKIYAPELGGYSDEFDRTVDKSRMDLAAQNNLLAFMNYAGGDTDGCLRVRKALKQELLKDPALTGFYVNILHPAARAFEEVEQGGVCVDINAYQELESALNTEIDKLLAEGKKILGGRLVAKHSDPDKRGGLNLTKASLLIDFMFSPMGLNLRPKTFTEGSSKDGAKQVPSTAMDSLMEFKDVPEAEAFIALLSDYSSATKTLSTYVHGFQEHIRSDGRFHPAYWLFAGNKDTGDGGTVTGRLSVKNPAFQCLVAESMVLTAKGERSIASIVDGYANGREYRVLTHTGTWRDVVGVYRNGVQPVLELKFSNGSAIKCTGNHPILTNLGWVRADQLTEGATAYASIGYGAGSQNPELHESDVLLVGGHEESLPVAHQQGLGELRGPGHQAAPTLDVLRRLSERYGREAGAGLVDREAGSERQLRASELPLGVTQGTAEQPAQYEAAHAHGQDPERSAVGNRLRRDAWQAALSPVDWDADGASAEEREAPDRSAFEEVTLLSITPCGEAETFDLTIQSSHSFVANGIVVHNTIPKHTKWAKMLRRCFNAPPGMFVLENDYSQGELRVIACLANEISMIQAYLEGKDLHAVTSGRFAGYSYEEMMELQKANVELFDSIRQLGKAGNFGLIYGMGEDGFHTYAEVNYKVKITLAEAVKFRTGFFETYPALPVYHREYKQFAKKHGFVRSPLGRIRHLPLINSPNRQVQSGAERQAINSPVQGCLSDMLIWAAAITHKNGWYKESPCFGAIHDAKYTYIPQENWEFYAKREKEVMENLPFEQVGWNPQLPFPADGKYGPNMGELKKISYD